MKCSITQNAKRYYTANQKKKKKILDQNFVMRRVEKKNVHTRSYYKVHSCDHINKRSIDNLRLNRIVALFRVIFNENPSKVIKRLF